jgi:catechol 2,3-dioxygenase-like lactoylglutathione lyase family enzyme
LEAEMSGGEVGSESAAGSPAVKAGELRLEVVVLPVSDVDRAKDFYVGLGWKLDADIARGDDFRIVQLTPPPSAIPMAMAGCSRRSRYAFPAAERRALMATTYESVEKLAEALRRAAAAHGKHEERMGQADEDWPDWYALYMVRERAGEELPT